MQTLCIYCVVDRSKKRSRVCVAALIAWRLMIVPAERAIQRQIASSERLSPEDAHWYVMNRECITADELDELVNKRDVESTFKRMRLARCDLAKASALI